jgi:serine/threonine protein kinase
MISAGESPPTLSDFQLLRCIGRGAYGEVWLARNLTGSFVAVKVVRENTFDHARPFDREFEGIKRFEPISRSDPSQLPILHVGKGEGFFYYVMELADDANGCYSARVPKGEADSFEDSALSSRDSYVPHTLREDLKRRGGLPVKDCVSVGLALTRALAHLHKAGLVHRDVKPSNVVFVGGIPKLADIGLVTSVDATRSVVGTEGYVAPEGSGTPEADLYSLGKLLYEMSTGCDRKEFPALPSDIVTRPDRGELVELNAVITRACQFDPRDRYPNAETMLAELALLERGQSVVQRRTQQHGLSILKRAGLGVLGFAVVAALATIVMRGVVPYDPFPDGPNSTNVQAELLCSKGLDILRNDNSAQFAEAYTNFHRAIDLDPNYARPYVGLLEITLREPVPGVDWAESESMRHLADKLEQLAPHLAATSTAEAIISFFAFDFPAAEHYAKRATQTNPKYELAHTWYGFILTHWGRSVEARAELEKSLNLLRSKAIIFRCIGHTYYIERRFPEALDWYRKATLLDHHHGDDVCFLGRALRASGDYRNALDKLESAALMNGTNAAETRQRYQSLREALRTGGVTGYWRQEWKLPDHKADRGRDKAYEDAIIQIHLGKTNDALGSLEQSFKDRQRLLNYSKLSYLLFDEHWDSLHNHPRFKQLLEKLSFTKVMPTDRN